MELFSTHLSLSDIRMMILSSCSSIQSSLQLFRVIKCLGVNETKRNEMRMKFFLAIIVLTLISCGYKKSDETVTLPKGTYKGQFIRSSPLARYAPSDVTITFAGDTFTGESDKPNYPAICQGLFKVDGKNIEFTNECLWTADFDWSFILREKFEFSLIDGKLELTKTVGDTTDRYSLVLQ
jgi:hypothetical protein